MYRPLQRGIFSQQGAEAYTADDAVVTLLHFNEDDGDTSTTDAALGGNAPHSISFLGNAEIDTAQSKFGLSSYYRPDTNARVTIADDTDFAFGTDDMTIEGWMRWETSVPSGGFSYLAMQYVDTNNFWWLRVDHPGDTLEFGVRVSGVDEVDVVSSGLTIAADTWYHVAASRSGTSIKVFFDGVEVGSGTSSYSFPNFAADVNLGGIAGTAFVGWIDEVRITNGYCWYRNDFDVPTVEFTPYIIDPADIANLELWIEARKETAYSDGDSVSTATDQSGNNNDGTNTGTNRPVYKTSIINGEAVYRFNGTTQWLDFGKQISKPSAFTVFGVFNADVTTPLVQSIIASGNSGGNNGTFWGQLAISNGFSGSPQGSLAYSFGSSLSVYSYGHTTASHINPSTDYIAAARYTSGDNYQESFVDNQLVANSADVTLATSLGGTNYNLSVGRSGEMNGNYIDGDIAAILLYTGALTDQQLQNVTRYLASVFT